MSFLKKGKILPKKGNFFPKGSYAVEISLALRQNLGNTHRAVKTLMRWTGASERTVKNWLSGSSGPSGEHLIALMHHSDEALEAVLRLAGREQVLVAMKVFDARDKLIEALELLRASTKTGSGSSH
jgi:hypothetical protein